MYVTIPIKVETKELLDEFKRVLKAKSYDETVRELAKANRFMLLAELEGSLEGTPKFQREKLVRDFD